MIVFKKIVAFFHINRCDRCMIYVLFLRIELITNLSFKLWREILVKLDLFESLLHIFKPGNLSA